MASKAVQQRTEVNTVHPDDEPSAAWGWHGTFPKGTRIACWFAAFALFAMLYGNHRGNVENIWLIGLGLTIVSLLLWDIKKRRTAWRK